jgi:hypothetical protein
MQSLGIRSACLHLLTCARQRRVSAGYAAKQQASKDKPNLLSCFYVWREWVQRRRRLAHLALRLQHWYVHRWLLGRAWDR